MNYSAKANVEFNGDFFRIVTMSQGMLSYAEPSADPIYLVPEVSDSELGRSIRRGLSLSRRVTVSEFQEIFKSKIVELNAKARDDWAIKQFGYKKKRDLSKNMDTCLIQVGDGRIEIQPTHQNSLDTYTITKDDGPFPLYVDENVSDAELGATLKRAMTQCTSSIR
jgi:hypothetical protein